MPTLLYYSPSPVTMALQCCLMEILHHFVHFELKLAANTISVASSAESIGSGALPDCQNLPVWGLPAHHWAIG